MLKNIAFRPFQSKKDSKDIGLARAKTKIHVSDPFITGNEHQVKHAAGQKITLRKHAHATYSDFSML